MPPLTQQSALYWSTFRTTFLNAVTPLNVRGLANFSKRKDVLDFLRCQSADIICLQELHVALAKENIFKNQWGGRAWIAPVSSASGGVGIFIQNKLSCNFIDVVTNHKGSAIFLSLEIHGVRIKIGNVYGPPERDDHLFFEEIFRQADSDQQEHLIICGDWNLSLNPEVDQYTLKNAWKNLYKTFSPKYTHHSLNAWRGTKLRTEEGFATPRGAEEVSVALAKNVSPD